MTKMIKTKTLLVCGVIAAPLFVIAFLIEGATHTGYNSLRHPVSSLAFGDWGWTQSANFLITGLLTLAFAIGLRRALRPLGGPTGGTILVGYARSGCSARGSSTSPAMPTTTTSSSACNASWTALRRWSRRVRPGSIGGSHTGRCMARCVIEKEGLVRGEGCELRIHHSPEAISRRR
jgi:hypothetical protein